MFTDLLVLILLILLNAFFAASEMALVSLNDNKVRMMAEEGDEKALLILGLLKEPSAFLATIQIGITLAGFLASAFASESFADPLVKLLLLSGVNLPEAWLKTGAVFVVTLVLSYFTLVLGELVPKRIAMRKSESISMKVASSLRFLSRATSPFVKLLTHSTNFVVRRLGVDPLDRQEDITEEEIRMMVDVGEERGTIQRSEKDMINNIFEFDDMVVSEIMTHRTEITGIPCDAGFSEALQVIQKEHYSRIPVYDESIDDIVGILHVKDLVIVFEDNPKEFKVQDIMREPYFVPVSKRTNELFKELKLTKTHMAVVIDEYGGTAGIITLEDLIEEIVGNISDEYDDEEKEIEKLDESTYIIDGSAELEEVEEVLGTELKIDRYETMSGFIIGQLGRIPKKDENPVIEYKNLVFKVMEVEEKRISRVKVCKS